MTQGWEAGAFWSQPWKEVHVWFQTDVKSLGIQLEDDNAVSH